MASEQKHKAAGPERQAEKRNTDIRNLDNEPAGDQVQEARREKHCGVLILQTATYGSYVGHQVTIMAKSLILSIFQQLMSAQQAFAAI